MSRALIHKGSLVIVLGALAPAAADELAELKLTLTTTRSAYALGEPVVFAGALKNMGKHPVREYRADRPRRAEAIDILISEDGVEFVEYRMGIYPSGKVQRSLETLQPNEAWSFELRILYTYKVPSRLAFERPGKYYVKAAYPLIRASAGRSRQVVESNVVCFQINAPEAVDAKIWTEIRKPEFLYFLQSGHVEQSHAEVVRRAIDLLRTIPKSNYHAALRWALLEYYRQETHGGARSLDPDKGRVLEEIRKLLGADTEIQGCGN